MSKKKILVVDDEPMIVQTFEKILTTWGYDVSSCFAGKNLFSVLAQTHPDIILLDVYLGELNGIQLLKKINKEGWKIPVVMITGQANVNLAVEAMKEGAEDFIEKPIDLNRLKIIIEKALLQHRLINQVSLLKEELEETRSHLGIIYKSDKMHKVLQVANKLAKSNTTVLLEGESGTGKELIARYIYEKSNRADNLFITINCGAIPKDLAESELFGYEKGAFTGASEKMKLGKFELADGGTILLDEIGELSLEMQVKLLRVLEEKKFYRLGGNTEIKVDVRIIAATNRNLAKEVAAGRFREDLYYRINVASIHIPPLRERPEDIPPITAAFQEEFSKRFGKPAIKISKEAIEYLQAYRWKGNVRELRNAIERVNLLNDCPIIEVDHFYFLDPVVHKHEEKRSTNSEYNLDIPPTGIKMEKVVKDLILKTLILTNGNQVQAAKILGISRSKLRYRMEQLGIDTDKTAKIQSLN